MNNETPEAATVESRVETPVTENLITLPGTVIPTQSDRTYPSDLKNKIRSSVGAAPFIDGTVVPYMGTALEFTAPTPEPTENTPAQTGTEESANPTTKDLIALARSLRSPRDPDLAEFKKQVIAAFAHLGLDTRKFFGV